MNSRLLNGLYSYELSKSPYNLIYFLFQQPILAFVTSITRLFFPLLVHVHYPHGDPNFCTFCRLIESDCLLDIILR